MVGMEQSRTGMYKIGQGEARLGRSLIDRKVFFYIGVCFFECFRPDLLIAIKKNNSFLLSIF